MKKYVLFAAIILINSMSAKGIPVPCHQGQKLLLNGVCVDKDQQTVYNTSEVVLQCQCFVDGDCQYRSEEDYKIPLNKQRCKEFSQQNSKIQNACWEKDGKVVRCLSL